MWHIFLKKLILSTIGTPGVDMTGVDSHGLEGVMHSPLERPAATAVYGMRFLKFVMCKKDKGILLMAQSLLRIPTMIKRNFSAFVCS